MTDKEKTIDLRDLRFALYQCLTVMKIEDELLIKANIPKKFAALIDSIEKTLKITNGKNTKNEN